ncbi:hypothetical protein N431DRAFT_159822 [Stipitochalara longipes BDJ]|nr:hypothetical protein N431DRAFT_159822 [Stipitochalara longipes BDJ]
MSFLQLSDEIILLTFEQVTNISPRSLLDLCLVSKRFCTISSPLLYRCLRISPHNLEKLHSHDCVTSPYTFRANMLTYSRHITVNEVLDWDLFADILSGMQRLDTIRWHYWDDPFPITVKNCLIKLWPDSKLFVEDLSIGFQTDVDEVQLLELDLLKTLVSFQNIHSVKVVIEYEHPVAMRWLKDVLLSSPKLTILHLTLPRNREGLIEWLADGLGSYDLCAQPGERLGPLDELVYETRLPAQSAQEHDHTFIPASFFDLTRIRLLTLRGFHTEKFLLALEATPIHVTAIAITCCARPSNGGLENFIPRTRGVETLKIISTADLLPIHTVFHLRDTLTNIELRYTRYGIESISAPVKVHFYSPTDLDDLREACPQISSLVLDMEILNDIPYHFLNSLALFPRLSKLRLYFQFKQQSDLGPLTAKPPHISTDQLTAIHLFSYLRERKTGVALDKLEVMMGDRPLHSRRVDFWRLADDDRPSILFTCRENARGEVIVEHDPYDDEDVSWWSYFDPNKPKTFRGQTYPDNLLDMIQARQEASNS